MISVPARRVKQFGVEFYQAGLTAKDIDRLVKFEVLGYSGGPEAEPVKARKAQGRARPRQLGHAGEADQRERDRVPAPGHPPQDRRARRLLPRVQGRRDAAGHPRRGDHHLREALHLHAGGRSSRSGPAADPRGARRAARARRPAPAAGAARAQPDRRGLGHRGAGRAVRLARRAADRRAVRDDQRQAHAPQPLAHHQPDRAQALPRSQPGARARRHPLAQRGRHLAAARRDQDARHRPRPREPGPAGRGDRRLPGDGREGGRRRPRSRRCARTPSASS